MASYVICTNSECAESTVPKDNSRDYPLDEIRCGACGSPVRVSDPPETPEEEQ